MFFDSFLKFHIRILYHSQSNYCFTPTRSTIGQAIILCITVNGATANSWNKTLEHEGIESKHISSSKERIKRKLAQGQLHVKCQNAFMRQVLDEFELNLHLGEKVSILVTVGSRNSIYG